MCVENTVGARALTNVAQNGDWQRVIAEGRRRRFAL